MLRFRSPLLNLLNKSYLNNVKYKATTATDHASSNRTEPMETSTAQGDSAGIQQTKASGKQPARKPLVKNFFVGVVDKELLAYPEVIPRDEMKKLHNELLPLKNFFKESVDVRSIDVTRSIPPELLESVRELGLFGLNAPYEFDGRGWQWTESLIACEEEASSTDIALSLLSHRVVIDVLNETGSDAQKERFLSKLAKGSMIATEAIYEFDLPEHDFFNTKAEFNSDKNCWSLNGEKSFVVCGPRPVGASQLFLVLAQTQHLNMTGYGSRGTTVFLVESDSEGVKVGDQHLSFGIRGVQSSTVRFENVVVPESCVLGESRNGNQLAETILRASRLRQSLIGLVQAKNVVNELTNHFVHGKKCGMVLNDLEINRAHLSEAVCATYAMESMIYMTAGLLDEFEEQDVALEAAITKFFTMKQLFQVTTKFMDIVGPKCLLAGQPTEIAIRNVAQLYTLGESMDMLSIYIAISGLQHAGSLLSGTVRKGRNPLFNPMHILSKMLQNANIENPKTKLRLHDNVHPSLEPAAQCIEQSVARLQMCVEQLLLRYGSNVVEHHREMQRLTEMITNIYAMFASVARASRSYCIGLPLADHEMLTASTISQKGSDRVKTLCAEVFHGQYINNDNNIQRLAKQIVKSKGYFATHPLTFNF